jgi:rhodanese-related sulfurtransferase
MNLEELIKSNKVTIVDVRTEHEFAAGRLEESLNIPLSEIPQNIDKLKNMLPIVMCCAAGIRSGNAVNYLNQIGLEEVYNGGSWQQVQQMKNN